MGLMRHPGYRRRHGWRFDDHEEKRHGEAGKQRQEFDAVHAVEQQ